VVGVFIGFDNPKPMGRGATGGALAAPVFKEFMQQALEGKAPIADFRVPQGMKLIEINRKTGMRRSQGGRGCDPGSIQARHRPFRRLLRLSASRTVARWRTFATISPRQSGVVQRQGGLY
jgi:penicillin-binding protein 1A